MPQDFHERLTEVDAAKSGTERSFGLTFGFVFLIISLFPLIYLEPPRLWPLPIALIFFICGLLQPDWLKIPNRLWFRFGMLLHRIVNPLVLGMLFFVVIIPVALAVRLFGGQLLGLSYDPAASTYWIVRNPPGPDVESIRNRY